MPRLLLAALLWAGPALGQKEMELSQVRGIPAPLGRMEGVVEPPPEGGLPAGEKVVVTRLSGCEREQAIYLTRFLAGVLLAASQVQSWLQSTGEGAPLRLEKKLFRGRDALSQAVGRSRRATLESDLRAGDWSRGGSFIFQLGTTPSRPVAAVAQLSPGEPDRCLPKLSAVLYDDRGTARLRYQASGAAPRVELLGDGCQVVELTLDEKSASFRPFLKKRCGGAR